MTAPTPNQTQPLPRPPSRPARRPRDAARGDIAPGLWSGPLLIWLPVLLLAALLLVGAALIAHELRRSGEGGVISIVGAMTGCVVLAAISLIVTYFARRESVRLEQAQRELRESEARFRVIADQAPVLIWVGGADGRRTYFNEPWLEFTGRTLAEEVGDGWQQRIHPDDAERVRGTTAAAFALREAYQTQYRVRRSDGVYRWLLDSGSPRFDETGAFVGYLGSCVDITTRRETEEALRSSVEQLRQSTERQMDLLSRETMLRRELNHRVRNNLAGLLGLVSIYERTGRDGRDVADAIRGKVHAMKEVHDLISGAVGGPIRLGELIDRLALQFVPPEQEACFVGNGENIQVSAAQAGALAMIIQELFTNSRKHGVLASGKGKIAVQWRNRGVDLAPGAFSILWRERGQPATPTLTPSQRRDGGGVGLRLVQGLAQSELRGSFDHRVIETDTPHGKERGVDCTIVVGTSDAEPSLPSRSSHAQHDPQSDSEPAGAT
ncbi:MAG: PAS domain S-box protein [Planctomycetota bacterium]|nr:PAS domain S-box protein [Planctomycetota bacterium]